MLFFFQLETINLFYFFKSRDSYRKQSIVLPFNQNLNFLKKGIDQQKNGRAKIFQFARKTCNTGVQKRQRMKNSGSNVR